MKANQPVIRRTPEALSELPNARLMRRHDAVRKVWQSTRSENTARRCECRLSVLCTAARIQTIRLATAVLS